MHRLLRTRVTGLLPLLAALLAPAAARAGEGTYALVNGHWFDGTGFVAETRYVVDGYFTLAPPGEGATTLDLGGGYVIPPFAEAHNHNIESTWGLENQIRKYLEQGIFYVKILNSVEERAEQIADRLNGPETVDVAFAHAGITGPMGHPVRLYEEVLWQRAYRQVEDREWFRGRAYSLVESLADLDRVWTGMREDPPDFVKVFLLYSEEHEERTGKREFFGRSGLDPKLLPWIVARAHGLGLPVSAHVETATDFHHAVAAGVDEVSHLPGYDIPESRPVEDFTIREADARRAGRAGITVVTTTLLSQLRAERHDEEWLRRVEATQRRNLRLLHEHGVPLGVGSDDYFSTAFDEALNLHDLGVFDNLTLLKMWVETTPATIFPHRRIGRLEPGYEASFLVLGGDPIADFRQVRDVRLRFKQGRVLTLAQAEGEAPASRDPARAGESR